MGGCDYMKPRFSVQMRGSKQEKNACKDCANNKYQDLGQGKQIVPELEEQCDNCTNKKYFKDKNENAAGSN